LEIKTAFGNLSIRKKLTLAYIMTAVLILLVNIFVYVNVNRVIDRLDRVYVSNINLNELSNSIDVLQREMSNFLETKTTDAMDAYYKAYQDYEAQTEGLSLDITASAPQRMERNIRKMSESYLNATDAAIEAKRGRNVEKYRAYYEEATVLYGYIKTYINSLNTERFKSNSADYKVLSVSLSYIEIINIAVFIAVTIINVIIVILIVNRITKPLAALATAAEEVAEGNYDVRVPEPETMDETGVLNETFSRMLVSIKQGVLMEAHLKDAQLKFLQAQINPHFLFNTLNAGAQLAMMEDADKTYDYIQNVADFFRYNTQKLDHPVPLSDELKMVDTYIYIINIRFSGEVGYEKEVDESLLEVTIPSMILQPIVENAIQHGIRNIPGQGKISLSVFKESKDVLIRIADNGVGMTREQIEKIYEGKEDDKPADGEHGGVGLKNVMGRLKLSFDRDDVFVIESEGEGKGTVVTLRIPIEGEGSGKDNSTEAKEE